LTSRAREQLLATAGVRVRVAEPAGLCPVCGGPMRVQKSVPRPGATLAHGCFDGLETVHVCGSRCAADGTTSARRQPALARLLPPRGHFGYDVMVFAGVQRFLAHRRRDEIRASLAQEYGIRISDGELSALQRDFLVYLEALHQKRAPQLHAAMEADGGWPLHVDATGEDGRGTLLAVYSGWRGWVLGAWKIATERADLVLPRLRCVEQLFGAPCAVMRDLGRAVTEATRDFVDGRAIPVLACHMHFVKDVGKDLLRESHDALRDLMRAREVLARVRALAKELGRAVGPRIGTARLAVAAWAAGSGPVPPGDAGLAAVRTLAQHVLDYPDDGTDAGFPIDRPFLDLYDRCLEVCRAAESLLRRGCDDQARSALERLHRIVAGVRDEAAFAAPVRALRRRAQLFDQLRDALRLHPRPAARGTADAPNPEAELRDVRSAVDALRKSLETRPAGRVGDMPEAIALVLDHLKRHGPSLWGHAIQLPDGTVRLVARTNVLLEAFFHLFKHGERRRCGRKILTQDLELLPAAALLACNLGKPDYLSILCGTLDDLPAAFAQLDSENRSLSLPARLRKSALVNPPAETASASLPKADRDLVRTDAVARRIAAEAARRTPRLAA